MELLDTCTGLDWACSNLDKVLTAGHAYMVKAAAPNTAADSLQPMPPVAPSLPEEQDPEELSPMACIMACLKLIEQCIAISKQIQVGMGICKLIRPLHAMDDKKRAAEIAFTCIPPWDMA